MNKKRNMILKRLNRQLKNIDASLNVIRDVKADLEDITKKAEEIKSMYKNRWQ